MTSKSLYRARLCNIGGEIWSHEGTKQECIDAFARECLANLEDGDTFTLRWVESEYQATRHAAVIRAVLA